MAGLPITKHGQPKPKFRRMAVYASWICRVVRSTDLNQLAHQILEERRRDWEERQLRKLYGSGVTSFEYSDDYWEDDGYSSSFPLPLGTITLSTEVHSLEYVPQQQPPHFRPEEIKRQRKIALELYKRIQEDVEEVEENLKELKDPDKIIKARTQGRAVLKDGSKGLVVAKRVYSAADMTINEAIQENKISCLIETAGPIPFKLKTNSNFYHQVQAVIYAGTSEGYEFCDFLLYLSDQSTHIERITADEDWQKNYVPKAREFCRIYNELIKE